MPEREAKQAPELAREVLAAGEVIVEQPGDRPGLEEALPPHVLRREGLAREWKQRSAEPGRRWNREPALASVDDGTRQERLDGQAQEPLLCQAADLELPRERKGEAGHGLVEVGDSRFERMGHPSTIRLYEQVVDEVAAEVDVLKPGELIGSFCLGVAAPLAFHWVVVRVKPGSKDLCASLEGEDLLPAAMAFERRQVCGANESLRAVVEARSALGARQGSDERTEEGRQRAQARREHVRQVRVVAAEELVTSFS